MHYLESILKQTVSSNVLICHSRKRSTLMIHADMLMMQSKNIPVFEIYYENIVTPDNQVNVILSIHLSGSDSTTPSIKIPLSYTKLIRVKKIIGIKYNSINTEYLERKLRVHVLTLALWAEGRVKDLETSINVI